jgi:hypothetical protein
VTTRSFIPRLTDIVEAIERVRGVLGDTALEGFEADWQSNGWSSAASKSSPKQAATLPTS